MSDVAVAGTFAPLEPLALVGGLILGALFVIGVAIVARRLLGVQVGFARTLLAGMVGAWAPHWRATTPSRSPSFQWCSASNCS